MNYNTHNIWFRIVSFVLVIATVVSLLSGAGRSNVSVIIPEVPENKSAIRGINEINEISRAVGSVNYKKALKDLNTPLDIYNYVRKNYRIAPGVSGSKELEDIVDNGVATASENALLLGQMLKDKGYQVNYQYGTACLNEEQVKWITCSKTVEEAEKVFAEQEMNIKKVEQEDGTVLFEVPHVWVKARIRITDYRSAGKNVGEYEWIELDAYVKNPDLDKVEDLTLIPLSLQYETKGENGRGKPRTNTGSPYTYVEKERNKPEFFKEFDSKTDFEEGDVTFDNVVVTEDNPYDIKSKGNPEGLMVKRTEQTRLDKEKDYNFNSISVSQEYTSSIDKDEKNYSGSLTLKLEAQPHFDKIDFNRNHAYAISNDMLTWPDAKKMCEDMGGHLVTFSDQYENDYIRDLAKIEGKSGYVAIGLTDEENEGRWKWVDGSDSSYTNWSRGEPNNGGPLYNFQDYAYMYSGGGWDDGWGLGNDLEYYACEWDSVDSIATPEVSTAAVVMTVPKNVKLKDDIKKNPSVEIITLSSGDKKLLWKANIKDNKELNIPVEVDADDAYGTVFKDFNLYYTAEDTEFNQTLEDIAFEASEYNEKGSWSVVLDTGEKGSHWYYMDMTALHETNSSAKLYAFASDDHEEIEAKRNGGINGLKEIASKEAYSKNGVKDVRGRYVLLRVEFANSKKGTVSFLDKLVIGANTEKKPDPKTKEHLQIDIKGKDVVDVNEVSRMRFATVTTDLNPKSLKWTVNGEEVPKEKTGDNIWFDFKAEEEGEYVIKAYYEDNPEIYAEKTVKVIQEETPDLKATIEELLRYPYFNMSIDKMAYIEGETVKVTTDIPDNALVNAVYDLKPIEINLKGGCFDIENVTKGSHFIQVVLRNKDGNTFGRTIWFDAYKPSPTIKTWFDKDKYIDGDNVTLYVEEGYKFSAANLDAKLYQEISDKVVISNDGRSITFLEPYTGRHIVYTEIVEADTATPEDPIKATHSDPKKNVKPTSLMLYFYINGVHINPELEDIVTTTSTDTTAPVIEVTTPDEKTEIKGVLKFIGSITDDTELDRYEMRYFRSGAEVSTSSDAEKDYILAQGSEPIKDDLIGELDTDALDEGEYTVRIEAVDKAGNGCHYTFTFYVEKEEPTTEEPTTEEPTTEESTTEEPTTEEITTEEETTEEITTEEPTTEEPTTEEITTEEPTTEEPTTEEPTTEEPKKVEIGNITVTLSETRVAAGTKVTAKVTLDEGMDKDKVSLYMNGNLVAENVTEYEFTSDKKGKVTIKAVYKDDVDGEIVTREDSKACSFYTVEEDKTNPIAQILTPDFKNSVTAPVEVTGNAYDESELEEWKLEYREVGKKEYTEIASGEDDIKAGKLVDLDPTMMMNSRYELRLSAVDSKGHTSTDTKIFDVEGELKVGNYHIGFTDITSPLSGTTVNVNRIYDSRNKNSGDFGYGWSMDVQSMKLRESHALADGYKVTQSGSVFNKTYRMEETVDHDVIVTYGDGRSDRFSVVINNGISVLTPISEVSFGFKCETSQKVKLEVLADTTALYEWGQLMFLDDSVYNKLNYLLTTENGEKIYLNTSGVYRLEDSQGHKITVDKNGYHSSDGKGIELTRDAEGRVTEATDPLGNKTTYKYDEAGDLISVIDSADRTVSYSYDKNHNLISITDPMGIAVSRNEYDDEGRLVATIDADGNRMEFSHDVDGRQEIVRDRRGNSTIYIYDDNGNVLQTIDALGNKTTNEYDKNNNVIKTTDALGNVTTFSYDSKGNILSRINGAGEEISANYTDDKITSIVKDGIICADIKYDKNDNITSVEDSDHNVTEFTYDANGNNTSVIDSLGTLVSYKYDNNNKVVESKDGEGNITKYVRDTDGRCIQISKVQNIDGKETTVDSFLSYDNAGNVIEKVDSLGHKVHYTYDACDNLSTMVDLLGNETKYEYDQLGNLTKILYSDGTFESFTYDENGNTISATNTYGVKVNMTFDKLDRMVTKEYVGGGKEIYSYDAVGNVTAKNVNGNTTTYVYDGIGRNIAVIDPYNNETKYEYDNKSNIIKKTDALGNTWTYTYDAKGNQTSITKPDNTKELSVYDVRGNVTEKTDAEGNKTKYSYDGAGHLIGLVDALGNKTTYKYDGLGNIINVTDANGNSYNYEYDSLSRVTKKTNGLGKSCTYEYDALGNIVKSTDYSGNITHNLYDEKGRIIKSTVNDVSISYNYTDESGNDMDRLTSVSNKEGTIKYQYDNDGRIISKIDTNDIKLEYEYTLNGKLSKLSTPYGDTSYEYDKMDRIVRVVDHNGNVTLYSYDKLGNRETLTYPNGLQAKYKYDVNSNLLSIDIVDSKTNIIKSYVYKRNKNGYPVSIEETDTNGTIITSYEYDAVNRLVSENIKNDKGSIGYKYNFDKVGNRTSKTVNVTGTISGLTDNASAVETGTTKYTYNNNNQLISETYNNKKTEYSYDDNGNLTKINNNGLNQSYEYNSQNKLSKYIDTSGKEFSYIYDAEGSRIGKSSGAGIIKYVVTTFDDLSNVILELDKDNKQIKHYTIGDDLLGVEISGADYSYIQDGHGNVAFLTDNKAAIVNTYTYDAYGNSLVCTEKVSNSFRYNSEFYDEESGLYYLRARYMNPATGTFTQEDTYQGNIYDAVSLHKYLFTAANPVVYEDPTGNMFSLTECSLYTAIQNTLNELNQLNSVRKLIKFAKTATCIVEGINICKSFQSIISGETIIELIGDIASIVNSIITIITITKGIEIGRFTSIASGLVSIIADSTEVFEAMEKGDTWGMVGGIASVVLDVIFMGLDFKEVKVDKVTNTIKNEGRNQLYDLSLEAILNGGISDSEMRELMSWSYDFDFSAEIFNLFN